jgi:hypothetical protein
MGHNWGSYPQAIHRVIQDENRAFRGETGQFRAETELFVEIRSSKIGREPAGTRVCMLTARRHEI